MQEGEVNGLISAVQTTTKALSHTKGMYVCIYNDHTYKSVVHNLYTIFTYYLFHELCISVVYVNVLHNFTHYYFQSNIIRWRQRSRA